MTGNPACGRHVWKESNLAESGERHRDLDHRITLRYSTVLYSNSTEKQREWQFGDYRSHASLALRFDSLAVGSVCQCGILVAIYSTATSSSSALWNVTLVPPLAVSDQEELSFASPAHALRLAG
jgi:hypothetical protein